MTDYLIVLNASGKRFVVFKSTLEKESHLKLCRICLHPQDYPQHYSKELNEFFFDRNSRMVSAILDLCRTGKLHLPTTMCGPAIMEELQYWEIPESRIAACCWAGYSQRLDDFEMTKKISRELDDLLTVKREEKTTLKNELWLMMEHPFHNTASMMWNALYLFIILLAISVIVLSYTPSFRDPLKMANGEPYNVSPEANLNDYYRHTAPNIGLLMLDASCLFFFLLELVLCFVTCPSVRQLLRSKLVILDIIVVIDMSISSLLLLAKRGGYINIPSQTFLTVTYFLDILVPLRALRVFHFMKRMALANIFKHCFTQSVFELSVVLVTSLTAVIVFGTTTFCLEMIAGGTGLRTIPDALWWSLATLTTVGYGDVYPESVYAKMAATFAIIFGVILVAMPTAVILSSFSKGHSIVTAFAKHHRTNPNNSTVDAASRE